MLSRALRNARGTHAAMGTFDWAALFFATAVVAMTISAELKVNQLPLSARPSRGFHLSSV
jgi:hypothetical protein